MFTFRIFAVLGLLLSFIDFIGLVTSSPICQADGCMLVNQLTPYGSIPFTIAGIILFTTLIILSFYKKLYFLIDYVIAAAFIVEGALLGYQEFYLNKFCVLCVGIAAVIGTLFIIRAYQNREQTAAMSFFALFLYIALFVISGFLYTPVQQNTKDLDWLPLAGKTLIYSKDCSHCEDLIAKLRKKKASITFVSINKARDYLAANGINMVPVLIDKAKNETDTIVGEQSIIDRLYPLDEITSVFGQDGKNKQNDSCNIDSIKNCNKF